MRAKLRTGEKVVIRQRNETSFWSGMSTAWWGPGDVGVADALFLTPQNIENKKQGTWLTGTFYATNQRIIFEGDNVNKNKIIALEKVDSFNLLSDGIEVLEENRPEQRFYLREPSAILKHLKSHLHNCILHKAKHCEEHLDYNQAIKLWEKLGKPQEAARIRKLVVEQSAVKVDQTVVHGDYIDDRDTTYVDDRDTIIQDSVVNKSNIGAGGKSKAEGLREAKSLFEEELIDESEYKQMKKEILGK